MTRPAGRRIGRILAPAALLAGLVGCTNASDDALPVPSTVTVLPAPGAAPKPVAAGPVTTTTTVPTTTTSMPGSIRYQVQSGDTLYGIAAKAESTVDVLLKLNPLKDPGNLQVGQVLIVPGPTTTTIPGAPPPTGPNGAPLTTAAPVAAGAGGPATPAVTTTAPGAADVTVSTLPAATKDG